MSDNDDPDANLTTSQRIFWEADKILNEKRLKGERHFLIKWKGVDAQGEEWKPSWEPESNCTDELVEEWDEAVRCM